MSRVQRQRRPREGGRRRHSRLGRRLLVEFDELLQVVEAGLGGGFGLGEEVLGPVGEFAGE